MSFAATLPNVLVTIKVYGSLFSLPSWLSSDLHPTAVSLILSTCVLSICVLSVCVLAGGHGAWYIWYPYVQCQVLNLVVVDHLTIEFKQVLQHLSAERGILVKLYLNGCISAWILRGCSFVTLLAAFLLMGAWAQEIVLTRALKLI